MRVTHGDDPIVLLLRQEARVIFVQHERLGNGAGACGMITGKHRDTANPVRTKQFQRLTRRRAYWIGNRNRAEQHAIDRHEHQRVPIATA